MTATSVAVDDLRTLAKRSGALSIERYRICCDSEEIVQAIHGFIYKETGWMRYDEAMAELVELVTAKVNALKGR